MTPVLLGSSPAGIAYLIAEPRVESEIHDHALGIHMCARTPGDSCSEPSRLSACGCWDGRVLARAAWRLAGNDRTGERGARPRGRIATRRGKHCYHAYRVA